MSEVAPIANSAAVEANLAIPPGQADLPECESAAIEGLESSPVGQIKNIATEAFERIAQAGSADQLRGFANKAIGEAKLAVGLATSCPEIALLGVAQKALGEAQIYIGEAKLAAENADAEPRSRRETLV